MKQDDIIAQIISELDSVTASDVGVRTEGGDPETDPPEIILDTDAIRLPNENGHNSLAGFTTDASGDKDGWEFHQYFQFTADLLIRDESEVDAHNRLETVQAHFAPYEFNSEWFNTETTEWEVGDISKRSNPVLEPDWYEFGVPIRFKYVQKTTKSSDTLTSIQRDVTEDSDTLEEGEYIID